jgi:hypothetical protein
MRAISSAKSSTYTTQTNVDRGPIYSREVSCAIGRLAGALPRPRRNEGAERDRGHIKRHLARPARQVGRTPRQLRL